MNQIDLSSRTAIDNVPSWHVAKENNFRTVYRPTGDAWWNDTRVLLGESGARLVTGWVSQRVNELAAGSVSQKLVEGEFVAGWVKWVSRSRWLGESLAGWFSVWVNLFLDNTWLSESRVGWFSGCVSLLLDELVQWLCESCWISWWLCKSLVRVSYWMSHLLNHLFLGETFAAVTWMVIEPRTWLMSQRLVEWSRHWLN